MFGYYYPYAMMGLLAPTMMGSMFSPNAPGYFRAKYGCEDCFRTQPYPREMPLAYTPGATDSDKPKRNLLVNILA